MNVRNVAPGRSGHSTAKSELGASAILIAFCMVLFLGIAAFAIDIGLGLSERRNDVTAADVGVMAGAVSSLSSNAQVRDQILSFTRQNLPTAYSNAAWQTIWEGCTDPELATLNTTGFNFIPLAPPTGWTVGSPWCISIDPAGYVRVRLPNQIVNTTFGRAIGTNQFSTSADAIARWNSRGAGGILPFALVSTASDGGHVCLRDASGGFAEEPCDGPDAGNFGALESPQYGNIALNTTQNCTGSPKKNILAINIAIGLDHRIVPDTNGLVGDEKQDTCPVIDSGETPDTLNTFTGLSLGTQEGLATGPVPGGFTPRLQQGSNLKRNIYGSLLDDRPLWDYLDGNLIAVGNPGGTIPPSCVKSSFNNSLPPQDWSVPVDGVLDDAESWEHIGKCLLDHVAMGAGAPIMFLETIGDSPRFSYVPQFWESALPAGNGWLHVLRFKSTWLQATWWRRNAITVSAFHPGEPGTFTAGGNWDLIQISGIIMPDKALPIPLRGTPGPAGGLSPFIPELYR